jgi:hypothetical protein
MNALARSAQRIKRNAKNALALAFGERHKNRKAQLYIRYELPSLLEANN